MKQKSHKVLDCKLIKVEKLFNQAERISYYYNLEIEGFDDLLLLQSHTQLKEKEIVGAKIKYKLNDDNEVSEFEFL
jgi:hypothetical protein